MFKYVIPHLHIRASGEANSEANHERTNHIFVSSFIASFASPFVVLALKAVFQHESKGTNGENGSFALTCTNMWMFWRMSKHFICIETEAYECLRKWRGEARARMCKCGINDITKTDKTQLLVTTIFVCKWVSDHCWRLQKLFLHKSLVQSL